MTPFKPRNRSRSAPKPETETRCFLRALRSVWSHAARFKQETQRTCDRCARCRDEKWNDPRGPLQGIGDGLQRMVYRDGINEPFCKTWSLTPRKTIHLVVCFEGSPRGMTHSYKTIQLLVSLLLSAPLLKVQLLAVSWKTHLLAKKL